jgi:hypothetical protein
MASSARCGNRRAYELVKLRRWQCVRCRHQVSLTSGTILHNTRTPLTVWFWAAYLMTTDKRGVSALLLQRQLALRRYETAWMMLHKFRRAMVNLAREPLQGEIEVDDTWVGGPQAGLRGSRQLKGRKAALVLVAVEKRDRGTGRARMAVIPDFKSTTLIAFLKRNEHPLPSCRLTASRASPGCKKQITSTYLAASPCESNYGRVPSRLCLWQIEPLSTCSSG